MARTLYLNDGSTEIVLGNSEDALRKVIGERLGRDCEELYSELLDDAQEEHCTGDDHEAIADGYLSMLRDMVDDLDIALAYFDKSRLDKVQLKNHLQTVRNNLYNNL